MSLTMTIAMWRNRPLSISERVRLSELVSEFQSWPWQGGGLRFELPVNARKDDLVGRAMAQITADILEDAALVQMAAELLQKGLADVRVACNDGEDADAWEGDDVGWDDVVPPVPEAFPDKLKAALDTLSRGPDPKALAVVRAEANVRKLLEVYGSDNQPPQAQVAAGAALAWVDNLTVFRQAIKLRKKLNINATLLLERAAMRCEDAELAGRVFLDEWMKCKGRSDASDLALKMPENFRARVARLPEARARFLADLANADANPTDEPICRRAGEAMAILGLAGTAQSACDIVSALLRIRKKRWLEHNYEAYTRSGVLRGLCALGYADRADNEHWVPPVATMLLSWSILDRLDKRTMLRGLIAAAPDRLWPYLVRLASETTSIDDAINALVEHPSPQAVDLLEYLTWATDDASSNLAAFKLLARTGIAGLPAWYASRLRHREPQWHAPYSLVSHGYPQRDMPSTQEGWLAWMRAHELEPAMAPALPDVERLPSAQWLRPRAGSVANWANDLQMAHRSGDRSLAKAIALGAAEYYADQRRHAIDWLDPEGLGLHDLAGLALPEQLAWLDARSDLPPQRLPVIWRVFDGSHLASQVLSRRDGGLTGAQAVLSEWTSEERDWLAAAGLAED